MKTATYVVPPKYQAAIFGCSAVKITARKVYLLGVAGEVLLSKSYNRNNDISKMSFAELVDFVKDQ